MSPRRQPIDRSRGIFEVDWQLFGELSRALALKVARGYDPELVVGIATAGVIPGATIAAILGPRVSLYRREPAHRHGAGTGDAGDSRSRTSESRAAESSLSMKPAIVVIRFVCASRRGSSGRIRRRTALDFQT